MRFLQADRRGAGTEKQMKKVFLQPVKFQISDILRRIRIRSLDPYAGLQIQIWTLDFDLFVSDLRHANIKSLRFFAYHLL